MASAKLTLTQKSKIRADIARLDAEGKNQTQIAEMLGTSQQMVSYYLKRLREEWRRDAMIDVETERSRKYRELDNLKSVYWEEYRKSKADKITTTTTVEDLTPNGGQNQGQAARSVVKRESRTTGEATFLNGAYRCIEKQIELYGLSMPKKIAPTDPSGQFEYTGLSEEERRRHLIEIIRAAERRAQDSPQNVIEGQVIDVKALPPMPEEDRQNA